MAINPIPDPPPRNWSETKGEKQTGQHTSDDDNPVLDIEEVLELKVVVVLGGRHDA